MEEASGSADAPRTKLRLKVMKELKTKEEWKRMSYAERRKHQEDIRKLLPPGTVGQHILKKQGSACSTCRSRRRKTRTAVQEYLQRKKKEYESMKKPMPAGLARSLLHREGTSREEGEGLEEEEPKEDDATIEVKEEKPPGEKEIAQAKKDHAARIKALREQRNRVEMGSGETTEADEPKAASAATADATSMSSSTVMQNLLHGNLLGGLMADRSRLQKRLEELKRLSENEKNEDDYEEMSNIEVELESILEKITKLKERGRAKAAPKVVAGRLDQSTHDARYRAAIAEGVSHARAWKEEKGRRRAAEQRRKGTKERAKLNVQMQRDWAEHFATRPGRKEDTAKVDAMETVVVDSQGKEIDPSAATALVAVPLTRKEKRYYRQEGEEELKPKKEKEEKPRDPEKRRKINEKRAMRRKRLAQKHKGKGKGEKRKATAAPEEDEDENENEDEDEGENEDEEDDSWGNWKSPKDPPGDAAAVASVEVSMATNAVSASGGREHGPQDQRVEVNFDSGAAVTVVPMKYGRGTEKPREEMKFKTASGQNIPDYGPIRLKGTTSSGNSATLCGRLADVHRVLGSASDICRSHYAVLGEGGGYLIPKGNEFGKDFDAMMKRLLRKHKGDPTKATRLHVRRGVYVFDLSCPFTGQPGA